MSALSDAVVAEVGRRHYGHMELTPDEKISADDLVRAWVEQVLDALGLEQVGSVDSFGLIINGEVDGWRPVYTSALEVGSKP